MLRCELTQPLIEFLVRLYLAALESFYLSESPFHFFPSSPYLEIAPAFCGDGGGRIGERTVRVRATVCPRVRLHSVWFIRNTGHIDIVLL